MMKVTGVNNILFKAGGKCVSSSCDTKESTKEIKNLGYVTPDFNIKTPVNYTKTGIDKLDNGLKIHNFKLANGYQVAIVPMEGSPAVVKTYVNVGSMNETPDIKGISHFLEHMAFNGTNGENGHIELKTGDSFKKIDEIGGWANASTNYAITDYVNSAPLLENKDLETQIKVIAAMAEDLKLSDDMIAKEKGPVSSEINMILDDTQTVAMDQTVRTLFNIKNPADELVGGSVKHIKNLTRDDVRNYYNKYYTPDNTKIVITGDVNPEEAIELVAKNFNSHKISQGQKYEEKLSPIQKTVRKDFKSDKTSSAEVVLGFAGPKNNDTRGKVLFDACCAYMLSHEAGLVKTLKEFNTVPAIDNEKISTNPNNPELIYLAFNPSEEKSEEALKAVYETISGIKPVTKESLERVKQKIKQGLEEVMEHSSAVNDLVGFSMLNNGMEYLTDYGKILDSITPKEVDNALKEYFNLDKAAVTVIHSAKKNKAEAQNAISFHGKERQPIDTNNISRYKLKNNYDIGLYNTKNKNTNVNISLMTNITYNKKAGVIELLNTIYTMGANGIPEDKFNEFKDKNNMRISIGCGYGGITAKFGGSTDNYELGLNTLRQLLYNPNINEETLAKAKTKLKDSFMKTKKTSELLTDELDKHLNPYAFSRMEIIKGLDSVTVDDVKELHNYFMKNSRGIIAANVPVSEEKNIKTALLTFANGLKTVEPNIYRPLEIYKDRPKTIVLRSPNNNSQADITQVFSYKRDPNSYKEMVVIPVMNSILRSSSIGLFDILREKENLAYSVYSKIGHHGDLGQISLNILTTTDNKNIGEYSYDNIQKSINGFNRQIGELCEGKFTDEDLDNAKRALKASLLNQEGSDTKLNSIEMGLTHNKDLDIMNKIYGEIDGITREDVVNYAKKVFAGKPVYGIVATQDTLDANKEFLDGLKDA